MTEEVARYDTDGGAVLITPLNGEEQKRLAELEEIIGRNMQGVFEWGCALMEIKGKELFRGTHVDFETYLRERWDIARNYANKLIAASSVIENIGTDVPVAPTNEAQARPLAKLQPHEQREVWMEAIKTAPAGKITAVHVAKLVQKHLGKEARKRVSTARDEMCREIRDVRFKNTFNDFMQQIIEAARTGWKTVPQATVKKHIQALLEAVK